MTTVSLFGLSYFNATVVRDIKFGVEFDERQFCQAHRRRTRVVDIVTKKKSTSVCR